MARALHRLSAAALKRNKAGCSPMAAGWSCRSPRPGRRLQPLVPVPLRRPRHRPRPLDGRRRRPHREPGRGPDWAREQRKLRLAGIDPIAHRNTESRRKVQAAASAVSFEAVALRIHGRERFRVEEREARFRMGEHASQICLPDNR